MAFWNIFRRSAAKPIEAEDLGDRDQVDGDQRGITWDQAAAAGLTSPLTAAGVSVTADTSLSCSPVYSAVRKITSAVGTLPLCLYERQADEGRTRAVNHPVYSILHDAPNPLAVPFTFWSAFVAQMLLYGHGSAEIEFTNGGDPAALWLLPSRYVRPNFDRGPLEFEYTGGSRPVTLTDSEVFHVPYFSLDGVTGKGIIEYARETIGTTKATESGGASFLANMVKPSGVVKVPANFSDTARENLRKSIQIENAGHRKTGRIMLLEDGIGFDPLGVSNVDAQWIEARSFSVAEVARFFNISPTKLADLTRATWGNIESENRSYIEDTLLPILTPIVQTIAKKLLTLEERKRFYAEHLLEKRLQGNTTERYAAYTSAINAGWMTRNEVRARENLDQRPGLDDPLAPLNMAPAPTTPKPPPAPAAKPDPAPEPE